MQINHLEEWFPTQVLCFKQVKITHAADKITKNDADNEMIKN